MKTRYIIFTIAHALFCAVAPIVFIFIQYGDTNGGLQYKLPLGAILVVVLLLIFAKNTLLRPRLEKMTAEIAQHEVDLKVESDSGRIANLVAELKRERTIEVILDAAVPLLVLAALLIGIRGSNVRRLCCPAQSVLRLLHTQWVRHSEYWRRGRCGLNTEVKSNERKDKARYSIYNKRSHDRGYADYTVCCS